MGEKPRAALVSINMDDGDIMHTVFESEPGREDPIEEAWALWRGIKNDWPEYETSVIANQAARDLHAKIMVQKMTGEDLS